MTTAQTNCGYYTQANCGYYTQENSDFIHGEMTLCTLKPYKNPEKLLSTSHGHSIDVNKIAELVSTAAAKVGVLASKNANDNICFLNNFPYHTTRVYNQEKDNYYLQIMHSVNIEPNQQQDCKGKKQMKKEICKDKALVSGLPFALKKRSQMISMVVVPFDTGFDKKQIAIALLKSKQMRSPLLVKK